MARQSRWNDKDRKRLLKMVQDGVPEQEIREKLGQDNKAMTGAQFAQQLKMAMVESGQIKQTSRTQPAQEIKVYDVTPKGRITISDFQEVTGYGPGAKFTLQKPRGKSQAWRLVPVEG